MISCLIVVDLLLLFFLFFFLLVFASSAAFVLAFAAALLVLVVSRPSPPDRTGPKSVINPSYLVWLLLIFFFFFFSFSSFLFCFQRCFCFGFCGRIAGSSRVETPPPPRPDQTGPDRKLLLLLLSFACISCKRPCSYLYKILQKYRITIISDRSNSR